MEFVANKGVDTTTFSLLYSLFLSCFLSTASSRTQRRNLVLFMFIWQTIQYPEGFLQRLYHPFRRQGIGYRVSPIIQQHPVDQYFHLLLFRLWISVSLSHHRDANPSHAEDMLIVR